MFEWHERARCLWEAKPGPMANGRSPALVGPGLPAPAKTPAHPGGGDWWDGIVDWILSGLDGAGFLIWDEECSGRTMSVIPRLTGKYTDSSIRMRCDPQHIVDKI